METGRLGKILLAKVEMWVVLLAGVAAAVGFIAFGWIVKRSVTLPPDARFTSPGAVFIASVPDYARILVENGLALDAEGALVERNTQIVELDSIHGLAVRDSSFQDDGILLVSAYSDVHEISTVYLFDLASGSRLWEWVPNYDEIIQRTPSLKAHLDAGEPIPGTDGRALFRTQAPLLLADGSIVIHSGEGVLARLDPRGNVMWTSDRHYHHSIERNAQGNIVVPVAVDRDESLRDDGYVVLSPEGELLEEHFLLDILLRNGYRGLVYGVGRWERDRFHLNDAEPIQVSDEFVREGDVMLSSRHLSTVLLYRPSEGRVVWLETGPWINQHDVDYLGDGQFLIFGNDWVRVDSDFPTDEAPAGPGWENFSHSNIYLYDMSTGETTEPFDDVFQRYRLRTPTQGSQRLLDNGDSFVALTDEHQLLRLNDEGVRWRYTSSLGDGRVGALHWSRYLYRDEQDLSWIPRVGPTGQGN